MNSIDDLINHVYKEMEWYKKMLDGDTTSMYARGYMFGQMLAYTQVSVKLEELKLNMEKNNVSI